MKRLCALTEVVGIGEGWGGGYILAHRVPPHTPCGAPARLSDLSMQI